MSTSLEITPELLAGFLGEAPEYLDMLDAGLLEFEAQATAGVVSIDTPEHQERMNGMFRAAHSLKGLAAVFGFGKIKELTHRMETLFDQLRTRERDLTTKGFETLFRVFDRLKALVRELSDANAQPVEIEDLLTALDDVLNESASPQSVVMATTTTNAPARTAPGEMISALTGEIFADPELVAAFVETTVESVEELNEGLLGLECDSRNNDLLNTVLRCAHNIKGASGAAGLSNMSRLTHEMETIFELLRNQRLALTDEMMNVLFAAVDRLRAGIELIRAGNVADACIDGLVERLRVFRVANEPGTNPQTAQRGAVPSTGREIVTPVCSPSVLALESEIAEAMSLAAPGSRAADSRKTSVPGPQSSAPAQVGNREAVTVAPGSHGLSKPTPAAQRTGETVRVDQERLDQLMNLGGELVIHRTRFTQLNGTLRGLLDEKSHMYVVDEIEDRLRQLGSTVEALHAEGIPPRDAEHILSQLGHLQHSFQTVRSVLEKALDARRAMVDFDEALHALGRVAEGLQKGIMGMRVVRIGPLFNRFRRVVRDIAKSTGKQVELVLKGENTELDKRMVDELGDPLTHMVRNSVDHGLELPDVRVAAGKNPIGTITLCAHHRGSRICIEVVDDGAGINLERVKAKVIEKALAVPEQVRTMSDREIMQYVLRPGFSTAQVVTDLSGRGMGLDIVVNKIEKLGGTMEIDSTPGEGTRITIRLPQTIAVLTAMAVRIGRGVYAVPLGSVAEIITIRRSDIRQVQRRDVVRVRERIIPVVYFEDIFGTTVDGLRTESRGQDELTLVLLGFDNETMGLVVDEPLGRDDVVIKSLAENYRNVRGIAGASIRGDGTVSLVLDVAHMMEQAGKFEPPKLQSARLASATPSASP